MAHTCGDSMLTYSGLPEQNQPIWHVPCRKTSVSAPLPAGIPQPTCRLRVHRFPSHMNRLSVIQSVECRFMLLLDRAGKARGIVAKN